MKRGIGLINKYMLVVLLFVIDGLAFANFKDADQVPTYLVIGLAYMLLIIVSVAFSISRKNLSRTIYELKCEVESLKNKLSTQVEDYNKVSRNLQQAKSGMVELKNSSKVIEKENIKLYKSVGAFLDRVSSSILKPLSIVVGAVDGFEQESKESSVLKDSVYKLAIAIEGMLDYKMLKTSKESSIVVPIDVDYYLNSLESDFGTICRTHSIQFKLIKYKKMKPTGEVYITCDPVKFNKIILTLLNYVLKFCDKNGTITVNLEIEDRHINLAISHTGSGVSPDSVEKLFEPYEWVNHEGGIKSNMELSLALAKELTGSVNGELTYSSEQGWASGFDLKIPLYNDSVPVLDLLFVDDEKEIREMFDFAIRKMNHIKNYKIMSNYDEAVDVLNSYRVKVIVTDAYMGEKGGVDLLEMVSESQKECKRFMLTGAPESGMLQSAIKRGKVDQVFYKPWKPNEMFQQIDQAIATSPINEVVNEYSSDYYLRYSEIIGNVLEPIVFDNNSFTTPLMSLKTTEDYYLIQIVDNDLEFCQWVSETLLDLGYTTIYSHSEKVAINQRIHFKPNLCIIGSSISTMSGENLVTKMKEVATPKSTQYIVFSGNSNINSLSDEVRIADWYMTLPIGKKELESVIANIIQLNSHQEAS